MSRNLDMESLREAVAELTPDERTLISLRFYEDLTLEEIGWQYGVTKMAISKAAATMGSLEQLYMEQTGLMWTLTYQA